MEETKGRRDELKGWGQQGAGLNLTRISTRPNFSVLGEGGRKEEGGGRREKGAWGMMEREGGREGGEEA